MRLRPRRRHLTTRIAGRAAVRRSENRCSSAGIAPDWRRLAYNSHSHCTRASSSCVEREQRAGGIREGSTRARHCCAAARVSSGRTCRSSTSKSSRSTRGLRASHAMTTWRGAPGPDRQRGHVRAEGHCPCWLHCRGRPRPREQWTRSVQLPPMAR